MNGSFFKKFPWLYRLLVQVKNVPLKYFFGVNIFLAVCSLSLLIASITLTPTEKGYGTHQRLGLPACMIAKALGVERCPSCGLTTACAYIGKGQYQRAFNIHPWALSFLLLAFIVFCVSAASLAARKVYWTGVALLLVLMQSVAYAAYWCCSIWEYAKEIMC